MVRNENITVWHTGLVQAEYLLSVGMIFRTSPGVTTAHTRIDPARDLHEQVRAQSFLGSVNVTVVNKATQAEHRLWQGTDSGLETRAIVCYDEVELPSGDYGFLVRVTSPAGAEFEWGREFTI
ncbi:hypothetical protein CFN78_14360 [Amycolatopsis antarctica]|uniref:Uncharacterized protein n=2 Tax=Amycolatopsis antarctica TaxID=1854586 RepID=A0A263D2U7_9PSEU|nr:hypothetical protein CFN78_14360 [Amycolatopsis antarctica]